MTDLKSFRINNRLTQTQIANYLGVGKSFICQIEHGLASLPFDKFDMLMNNLNGWDTSSLSSSNAKGDVECGSVNISYTSEEKCSMLERRIAELQEEVSWLRSVIDSLTKNATD